MNRKIKIMLYAIILINIITACGKGDKMSGSMDKKIVIKMDELKSKKIPNTLWEKLSKKKIYFGHMSVGYNIIDGIKDIQKNNSAFKLSIAETGEIKNVPVFAHTKNGTNGYPKTKVDAFVNIVDKGLGNKADIAFFKLCYVDITEGTDVNDLFNYYKSAMNTLAKKYKNTLFIHITVPLKSKAYEEKQSSRIKEFVKSIMGKKTNIEKLIESNINRNKFNNLLKKEYGEKFVFDLEKVESTYPNGTREINQHKGIEYFSLLPQYTYDGGHLNETGRIIAADNFLFFLVGLMKLSYLY